MKLPPNSLIASGPVIVENGRILLDREHKPDGIGPWMFPGGEVENFDSSLEETCRREAKEELGIDLEIIKPLRPLIIHQNDRVIILIHYLAKRIGEVAPGPEVAQWDWHDLNNLPKDCAPNVYEIITDLKTML